MRLEIIEKEKKFFTTALNSSEAVYNEFIQSLSFIERIAFWVASFFDSTNFDFNLQSLTNNINNPLDSNTFNTQKVAKFGETTITFEGNEIPVEIVSEFGHSLNEDLHTYSLHTYFYLRDKKTKENLGYIDFEREQHDLKIRIALAKDELIGDNRLIKRLLTQIAVEVFSCEPEVRLAANSSNTFPFATAGSPTASIHKMNKSGVGTDFVTMTQEKGIQPIIVDFELDAEPITWEQQIEANRLLTDHANGPILPIFIRKDYAL